MKYVELASGEKVPALGQGRLIGNPEITPIAKKHNVTNTEIALAFTLRLPPPPRKKRPLALS